MTTEKKNNNHNGEEKMSTTINARDAKAACADANSNARYYAEAARIARGEAIRAEATAALWAARATAFDAEVEAWLADWSAEATAKLDEAGKAVSRAFDRARLSAAK